jgi:hypothetical protein
MSYNGRANYKRVDTYQATTDFHEWVRNSKTKEAKLVRKFRKDAKEIRLALIKEQHRNIDLRLKNESLLKRIEALHGPSETGAGPQEEEAKEEGTEDVLLAVSQDAS